MERNKMKVIIRIDADRIKNALDDADSEGADSLTLEISGTVNKNKKDKDDEKLVSVEKIILFGECTTEYVKIIQ